MMAVVELAITSKHLGDVVDAIFCSDNEAETRQDAAENPATRDHGLHDVENQNNLIQRTRSSIAIPDDPPDLAAAMETRKVDFCRK